MAKDQGLWTHNIEFLAVVHRANPCFWGFSRGGRHVFPFVCLTPPTTSLSDETSFFSLLHRLVFFALVETVAMTIDFQPSICGLFPKLDDSDSCSSSNLLGAPFIKIRKCGKAASWQQVPPTTVTVPALSGRRVWPSASPREWARRLRFSSSSYFLVCMFVEVPQISGGSLDAQYPGSHISFRTTIPYIHYIHM